MFYFTPSKIASFFRSSCPSLTEYVWVHPDFLSTLALTPRSSALLNAGYSVSRSHAAAGSIKTDAPMSFVHDVIREFIKTHPVRRDKISDGSPVLKMLDKAQT
jgi:tRNA (guanine26-N2/guanine27-N2)-dimethyltransferase